MGLELRGAGLNPLPNRNPVEEELFVQCASMVNAANARDRSDFNPDFALEISDGELRGAR